MVGDVVKVLPHLTDKYQTYDSVEAVCGYCSLRPCWRGFMNKTGLFLFVCASVRGGRL